MDHAPLEGSGDESFLAFSSFWCPRCSLASWQHNFSLLFLSSNGLGLSIECFTFFQPCPIPQFQSHFHIFRYFVTAALISWCQNLYSFPRAAMTNYHKRSHLKQDIILSLFWRPEVWKKAQCHGIGSFWRLSRLLVPLSQLPVVAGSLWHFLAYRICLHLNLCLCLHSTLSICLSLSSPPLIRKATRRWLQGLS